LRYAGANVIVCGTWWSSALADEDELLARALDITFEPVVDIRNGGDLGVRLLQRLARELFSRFSIASPRSFGLGAPELLRAALRINADLTVVHSESGLWVAKQLLISGLKVATDFEDWFSQDLLESDRRGRPVQALQQLERHLLRHGSYCTTTTHVMARAMAADAGTTRVPIVVPNCFPMGERIRAVNGSRDEVPANVVSFHWFSQTIGPGRGLEMLAQAMVLLEGNWWITLRGDLRNNGGWFNDLFAYATSTRVHILPAVGNAELLSRTMSHNVGLALEIPYCPSRDLTATNKIFEYMRAGLAIIATDTKGQSEVFDSCPDAGIMVPAGNAVALAAAMQRLIDDPQLLASCQKASASAGASTWAWEAHQNLLVNAVSGVISMGEEP